MDHVPAVVEVWDNALWGRAGEPWPPEQEHPTRQQRRDWGVLSAMESVWDQARQEDQHWDWLRQAEEENRCPVCGLGTFTSCRDAGSCTEAMREWSNDHE